jgi:hypothetical protein
MSIFAACAMALIMQAVEPVAAQPAVTAAAEPVATTKPAIPDGTEVQLTLSETLTTKKHVKGDLFKLIVTEDLLVDGVVILPKGTIVMGEVTRSETKAAFGVSGKIEARLLYAELPTGTLRLSGSIGNKGKSGTAGTALTYAAVGTIAFVVTGKSAEIKEGTELVGRIGAK